MNEKINKKNESVRVRMKDKKENKSDKKKSILIVTIILLIVLCTAAYFSFYFFTNYKLDKLIENASENEIVTFNPFFKNIEISESAIEKIKEKNLTLSISYNDEIISFNKDNITNRISLGLAKITTFTDIDEINDNKVLYVNYSAFSEYSLKTPEMFLEYDNLSLLAFKEENELIDISDKLNIEDGRIIISVSEYANLGYIIGFFEAKDVLIDEVGEDNILNLAKGTSKNINVSILPSIATNKDAQIESSSDEIVKVVNSEEGIVLEATGFGDATLYVSSRKCEKRDQGACF